jgi:hypothetical protein
VIISVVYLLVRCLLGCLMVLARHRVSKDAELLVLRHQNAALGPGTTGRSLENVNAAKANDDTLVADSPKNLLGIPAREPIILSNSLTRLRKIPTYCVWKERLARPIW